MDILEFSALELGKKIKAGEIGVKELACTLFDRIERCDEKYNSYITVLRDKACEKAEKIQSAVSSGEISSPLAGVPISIKDNICTKGVNTSCASKILDGFKPPYDATAVELLDKAGMVLSGKLNMDECGMGSTSETSYFGAVKNPWDTRRVPGGSSGGGAAAVTSGLAVCALGSDTGGSIRQPSAFCGITGIKPTYGTISRYGLIAHASSLDQIGPMARNAADCAALLDIISAHDKKDSTSAPGERPKLLDGLTADIKGMKIGLPDDCFAEGLDNEVKEKVLAAAKKLEELGAVIEYFPVPIIKYAVPTYFIIACAEASSNLSRFDGVKYGFRSENFDDLISLHQNTRSEGFGMEVKRRILLGTFALSTGYYDAYYKKALQVKTMIKDAFDSAFLKYDAILCPTAPTTAPLLGESLCDPLKMYLGDIYTVSVNLAGLPALSMPCGFDSKGMPIGTQLIGKHFKESTVLNIAYAYQQATDFHKKRPAGEVK